MDKIYNLKNNLKVLSIKRSGSRIVSISFRILAGSIFEEKDEIGIAHFLEHLVFDGTKDYRTHDLLSNLLDSTGAYRNGITNRETINFTIKVPKEDVEIAFKYLQQIVCYPLLDDNDIEKEKNIIKQEINRFKSDPKIYAMKRITSLLFPDTRLAVLNTGDISDIEKVKRNKIISFWSKNFSSEMMALVVVGDIDNQIKKLSEKYLGEMNMEVNAETPIIDLKEARNFENIVIPGIKQSTLVLAYRGYVIDTRQKLALDILSAILTRGKSSRLNIKIREERAMAYSVSSENVSGKYFGMFTISVGLDTDKVKECVALIKDEIRKIYEGGIDTLELEKAWRQLRANKIFSFEDSLNEASYYSNQILLTGKYIRIDVEMNVYREIIDDPSTFMDTVKEISKNEPSILVISPIEIKEI